MHAVTVRINQCFYYCCGKVVFTPICDSVHGGGGLYPGRDLCLGGSLSGGGCISDTPRTVTCRQYASCWNVSLLFEDVYVLLNDFLEPKLSFPAPYKTWRRIE